MVDIRVPEAIDARTALDLHDQVRDALATATSPLVLRGARDGFCGGVSLQAAIDTTDPRPAVSAMADTLERLLHSPVPTIAVVEGPAAGGGVGLLAACDRVLVTPDATFAMPELLYGLVPLVIAPMLRRRIDLRRLFWLALTGSARSAAEALEIGMVDEIVPSGDALEARIAATERLLRRVDPAALACMRSHLLPAGALHAELQRAVRATVDRLTDAAVRQRIAAYVEHGVAPWETPWETP